jgi:hypothetical protein
MKTAENRRGDDAVAVANPMAGRHWREVGGIRNAGSEARVRTTAIVVRDPVMFRSSAEPMVRPHARSNSAIRQGAVGGESLHPCRPLRDR